MYSIYIYYKYNIIYICIYNYIYMCIYIYEADKITYYAQWTWPKWVVPYRL
jgi:hypothetical protein